MRRPFSCQPALDTLPISEVPLNTPCRDEIIPVLAALKHLYGQAKERDDILAVVAQDVNATTNAQQGRRGLDYWQILVLAAVRLGCNLDYDKLQNRAEEHRFVVHDEVLGKGVQDQDVGVSALATAQEAVGGKIRSASFDRGFHSPANQVRMAEIVAHACL